MSRALLALPKSAIDSAPKDLAVSEEEVATVRKPAPATTSSVAPETTTTRRAAVARSSSLRSPAQYRQATATAGKKAKSAEEDSIGEQQVVKNDAIRLTGSASRLSSSAAVGVAILVGFSILSQNWY